MTDVLHLALSGIFLPVTAAALAAPFAFLAWRRLDDGCEDVEGGVEEWERWRRAYREEVRRG